MRMFFASADHLTCPHYDRLPACFLQPMTSPPRGRLSRRLSQATCGRSPTTRYPSRTHPGIAVRGYALRVLFCAGIKARPARSFMLPSLTRVLRHPGLLKALAPPAFPARVRRGRTTRSPTRPQESPTSRRCSEGGGPCSRGSSGSPWLWLERNVFYDFAAAIETSTPLIGSRVQLVGAPARRSTLDPRRGKRVAYRSRLRTRATAVARAEPQSPHAIQSRTTVVLGARRRRRPLFKTDPRVALRCLGLHGTTSRPPSHSHAALRRANSPSVCARRSSHSRRLTATGRDHPSARTRAPLRRYRQRHREFQAPLASVGRQPYQRHRPHGTPLHGSPHLLLSARARRVTSSHRPSP